MRMKKKTRVRVTALALTLTLVFVPLTYPIISNRKALRSIEGDFIATKQFGNRIFRIEERVGE